MDITTIAVKVDVKNAEREVASFKARLDGMGTASLSGVSSAFDRVKNASNSAGSMLSSFKGILAGIGVTTAFSMLANAVTNISEKMGDLNDKAEALGTTTNDLQTVFNRFNEGGLNDVKSTKALQAMQSALRELEAGTDKGIDAFKRLGLSAEDFDGKSLIDKLVLIRTQFEQLGDNASTRKGLAEIFGGEALAGKVLPLLSNIEDKLYSQANVTDETVKAWDDLGDAVARFNKTALNTSAETLKPLAVNLKLVADEANNTAVAISKLGGGDALKGFWESIFGENKIDWTGSNRLKQAREALTQLQGNQPITSGSVMQQGDLSGYEQHPYLQNPNPLSGEESRPMLIENNLPEVITKLSEEIRKEKELADVKHKGLMDSLDLLGKEAELRKQIATETSRLNTMEADKTEHGRLETAKQRIVIAHLENDLAGNLREQAEKKAEADKKSLEEQKRLHEKEEQRLKTATAFLNTFDTEQARNRERLDAVNKLNEAEALGLATQEEVLKVRQLINEKYKEYANLSVGEVQRIANDKSTPEETRQKAQKELERRLEQGKVGMVDSFKLGAQDAVDAWGSMSSQMMTIGKQTMENLESGATDYFQKWINGSMSAGQAFTAFGTSVLTTLERMLIQALIVKPIFDSIMGWVGGGSAGGTPAPVGHTGLTIGFGGGTVRRFHTGGIVGDEVPVIAKRGERIVAQQDMKDTAQSAKPVQIVNNYDPSMIGKYIAENPHVIINTIGANRERVNGILRS